MLSLNPDYVQVVDMGTLELRITAVKPGIDGERVSLVCLALQKRSEIYLSEIKNIKDK